MHMMCSDHIGRCDMQTLDICASREAARDISRSAHICMFCLRLAVASQ